METQTHCINCKTKLKGLMTSIKVYKEKEISFIKVFSDFEGDDLCEKCGLKYLQASRVKYKATQKEVKNQIKRYYRSFPILTIQPFQNWDFDALSIVSAQMTMDNRVSNTSFLDSLLGINDNVVDLDSSANSGEIGCMDILRQKTYALGGNAIVGVDIDYAEFGLKGELMLICMAGTGIRVKDISLINSKIIDSKKQFDEYSEQIALVSRYHAIGNK